MVIKNAEQAEQINGNCVRAREGRYYDTHTTINDEVDTPEIQYSKHVGCEEAISHDRSDEMKRRARDAIL